jgi:hypothetical protein
MLAVSSTQPLRRPPLGKARPRCYLRCEGRFGSLLRAYQLVGFTPDRDYRYIEINRALRALFPEVVSATIAGIERAGGLVKRNSGTS